MGLDSITYRPSAATAIASTTSSSPSTSDRPSLAVLDQLQLPHRTVFVPVSCARDGWQVIKSMKVRGAPAIAIVAALSVAVQVSAPEFDDAPEREMRDLVVRELEFLLTSRPTAVNLADAAKKLTRIVDDALDEGVADTDGDANTITVTAAAATRGRVRTAYVAAAERMLADDVQDNRKIGEFGAEWIQRRYHNHRAQHAHQRRRHETLQDDISIATEAERENITVLTHCNTGSLATAGHGTALGIIRSLYARKALRRAFYTETRPYMQGARLTGYELAYENIPATLIPDSAAASLLAGQHVDAAVDANANNTNNADAEPTTVAAVIVGADRVARNGDTANKIGTLALATLAKAYGCAFVVAAPRTSIDMSTTSGTEIAIEERPAAEMLSITGRVDDNENDNVNHHHAANTDATNADEHEPPKKKARTATATDGDQDTTLEEDAAATAAAAAAAAAASARKAKVWIAPPSTRVWNPAFDVTPTSLIDAIVTEVGVVEKSADGRFDLQSLFGSSR